MLVSEFPDAFGLSEIPTSELPPDIRTLVAGISDGISERIQADPILTDVFRIGENGTFSANPSSKILSGHFPGMPLVPGVVAKRLVSTVTPADPYHEHARPTSGERFVWKTEFPSAFSGSTGNVSVRQEEFGYSLVSGGDVLVRMTRFPEGAEFSQPEDRFDLRSAHTRDMFHEPVSSIPPDDADAYVFQASPFRFVTTAGLMSESFGDDRILGGYFDVPENFPYLSEEGAVPVEIVEESVAQIASFAYAKTRGFPTVRENNGEVNPKAKILTFKSSVSEAGKSRLHFHDRLSVAIEIISEDGREVSFAYEAWNGVRGTVLRGVIDGTVVPFRLLKRIAG